MSLNFAVAVFAEALFKPRNLTEVEVGETPQDLNSTLGKFVKSPMSHNPLELVENSHMYQ